MDKSIKKNKIIWLLLSFMLIITLSFTGCGKSNNTNEEEATETDSASSEQKGYIYNEPLENDTVYKDKEFKYLNNDKCNFAIPYPEHFEVKRTQDNNVTFYVDDDIFKNTDIRMYINIMAPGASLPKSPQQNPFNETHDAFTEADGFDTRLLKTRYNIASGERVKEAEIKSSNIETNFAWITAKESSQIYKAVTDEVKFDDFATEKGGEKYSSIKWYFYLDDEHPMVISTIVPQSKKDDMDKLLEYMISNMKRPVISDKTQDIKLDSSSNTYTIPASFSIENNAELAGATEGKVYLSPTNEGKEYAGAAIAIYHYDKNPEELSYEDLNPQRETIVASTMVDDLSGFYKDPSAINDLPMFSDVNAEYTYWLDDEKTESIPSLYGTYDLYSDSDNHYFWDSFNNVYYAFKVKTDKGFDLVLFAYPYEMYYEMNDLTIDTLSGMKDKIVK